MQLDPNNTLAGIEKNEICLLIDKKIHNSIYQIELSVSVSWLPNNLNHRVINIFN